MEVLLRAEAPGVIAWIPAAVGMRVEAGRWAERHAWQPYLKMWLNDPAGRVHTASHGRRSGARH